MAGATSIGAGKMGSETTGSATTCGANSGSDMACSSTSWTGAGLLEAGPLSDRFRKKTSLWAVGLEEEELSAAPPWSGD